MFILRSPLPAAVPLVPPLDGFTVGAAYGFRLLLTAYAGDCCRIRANGGDEAEDDFGFVDGLVDAAGIAAFIGLHGGTATIVAWYDQSGNGLHATIAAAGVQPPFDATIINGRPAAFFDGGRNLRTANVAGTSFCNSDEGTIFAVVQQEGGNAGNIFYWEGSGNKWLGLYPNSSADTLDFQFGSNSPTTGQVSGTLPVGWDDNPHVVEAYRATGGTQEILVDGSSLVSASRSDTISNSAFMGLGDDVYGNHLEGYIGELVFLKDDIGSIDRGTIRANTQSYFAL